MAKAKSIQTTNTNLLNARVIRADGTKTFINKVNANGYGTDAKGPQIHKTRIVQAGRTLKELPEALPKTECVLVGGIAHKLNKKQQKLLAAGDHDFVSQINVDLERLQFVDPDKATTARRPEHHIERSTPVNRKALAAKKAEGKPTAKRARKAAKAEGIEVDMLTKRGGTATRKRDRKAKAEQDTSVIKQMPRELKRLISDSQLKLNAKQTEQVLTALGLDAQFYSASVENHFDGLYLALPVREVKAKKNKKSGAQAAQYLSGKETKKLLGKLKTKLVAPTAKFVPAHKKKVKEVRKFWQAVLGLASPLDVKPGLLITDDYGDNYALVAIDQVSSVFVKTDGTKERLLAHSLLSQKSGHGKFTLTPADELDAAV